MTIATIDLNCDLGEGCGHDADLVPLISSANVSCGAHAGDADTIRETLRLCAAHGVAAGAHPGYADRDHFGRRETGDAPDAIARSVAEQLATFATLARECGVAVNHIKLHGALYNRAAEDVDVAAAIVTAMQAFDPALPLVGLSGSVLLAIAADAGLPTVHEVFPDRGYDTQGRLLPRNRPGAVIDAPDAVADRAFLLAAMGLAKDERGRPLLLRADTLCLHGDRDDAVAIAQAVRARLLGAGVRIAARTGHAA
jgi:UPF0271 protein